jgi:hypothetical protein
MAIPLAERERQVAQLADELCARFPLARGEVETRLRAWTHEWESLHEYWRAKGRPGRRPGQQVRGLRR